MEIKSVRERQNWKAFSDDYVVTVSADEGTEVDLKDKLALCIRLSNDFMSDYSD